MIMIIIISKIIVRTIDSKKGGFHNCNQGLVLTTIEADRGMEDSWS